ncbi:MAG TPA: hypothetical protein VNO82_16535 [Solirubrobacteraceae bacterium]|nr:hypothetical protein [Solirubrobacteraceae bacterium]
MEEHKHPARPEQPEEGGFAEGIEHKGPRTPDEEREPDFARGQRHGSEAELEHHGRFSEGAEEIPEEADPEKTVERRFSEGIERHPESE